MITDRTWYIFITMRYGLHKQLRYDHTQGPCHTRQSNNTKVSCTLEQVYPSLPFHAQPMPLFIGVVKEQLQLSMGVFTTEHIPSQQECPFPMDTSLYMIKPNTHRLDTMNLSFILSSANASLRRIWWISSETCVPARSHTILPLVPMHVVMC